MSTITTSTRAPNIMHWLRELTLCSFATTGNGVLVLRDRNAQYWAGVQDVYTKRRYQGYELWRETQQGGIIL